MPNSKRKTISDTERIKFWDYDKNLENPENVGAFSHKKFWWKCSRGHSHSYLQSASNRAKENADCLVCTNKFIVPGINDVATTNPELLEIWDYEKNSLLPTNVHIGSTKKIWFICDRGHSYDQALNTIKRRKASCRYCANKSVLPGYNDLLTTQPVLSKYWDYNRNTISPNKVLDSSEKKFWWLCLNGENHSFLQSPYKLTSREPSCYYCSGKQVLEGFNDLKTTNPSVIKYWDYDKNTIFPSEVTKGSARKVWWVCENKHSFLMEVDKMVKNKYPCSICARKKVLTGYNDLETTHHNILKYWNYEKNTLDPKKITSGNHTKVWWICDNGHEYQQSIERKTYLNSDCLICTTPGISKAEKEVVEYIKSILPKDVKIIENSRSIISPYELDIYIPEKKIAIEYNGVYWHTEKYIEDKYYHYNKWELCKNRGIQLITIWEDDWNLKKDIIKSLLSHKLQCSSNSKIYARKTIIDNKIDTQEARNFCDTNHIQGFSNGTYYFGLRNKESNELVALSIWRKNKDIMYLDRYCTSKNVPGGFSKLLKYAKNTFQNTSDIKQIVTFSDNSVSDGNLYEISGFTKDKEIKPDYSYFYKGKRHHKFGFRKIKFKNNPNLLYKENLTEKQLAELNGLERIYDYGKTRWVIEL